MAALSMLQKIRLKYQPKLPAILQHLKNLHIVAEEPQEIKEDLASVFPHTSHQPILRFIKKEQGHSTSPLKVGVVLSGGQAPGGHNVISGLFDALKTLNPQSRLIGFRDGPSGILKNQTLEITSELMASYRNQGGFDIIGSGRTKIEKPDQFIASEKTVQELDLDGLVIIGGDDSNTTAALLAEHFKSQGIKTVVVGVPKTIDGDLKNEFIEVSFGFDTACKIYSEIIGNILKDNLSAKKYYYFIKLMGRSASHVTLECALQTHVNLALIGEEVKAQGQTLSQLVKQIADLVCARAKKGKNYGVILISEGIVEFIPEFGKMIQELNRLLAINQPHAANLEKTQASRDKIAYMAKLLSEASASCFNELPEDIQLELLLDRDPHGNVQVSKIETERLFMHLVERELQKRKQEGSYDGKFDTQPLFCGYEGRSGLPSNFDSQYCYALGFVAALLIQNKATGYICCVQGLEKPVEQWQIAGIPIFSMMHREMRGGQEKPVIRKALVDLSGAPFKAFVQHRAKWAEEDDYCCPGPIQFAGPDELVEAPPLTLKYEKGIL